jgi:hypothetical protein
LGGFAGRETPTGEGCGIENRVESRDFQHVPD